MSPTGKKADGTKGQVGLENAVKNWRTPAMQDPGDIGGRLYDKEASVNHKPYYELTFAEIEDLAARKETIVSACGYLIASRDRKFDPRYAKYIWDAERANAIYSGRIPPDPETPNIKQKATPGALDDPIRMQREANATRPGTGRPVNAKGETFSWSPSAISDFQTCPLQYAHKRFYVTLPHVETEAMRQGTIEHKHLENRLKDKTPLPEGYTRGEKKCRSFEALATKGDLIAERELAISEDLQFVDWFDKKAWGRCKIDVTVVAPPRIIIGDWKTGKVKEDLIQLKINTCFLALEYPDIEEFAARYIWLKFNEVTPKDGSGDFTRDDIPRLWDEILGTAHRMEQAWTSENFPARSSGLCKDWCNVTSCTHCGKGR